MIKLNYYVKKNTFAIIAVTIREGSADILACRQHLHNIFTLRLVLGHLTLASFLNHCSVKLNLEHHPLVPFGPPLSFEFGSRVSQ